MANKTQKYDPELYDRLAWSLAVKGFTNEEIAEVMGISVRTLTRWRDKYPSFGKRLYEGRNLASSQVEESLFKKATGFTVTEEETVIKFDNDGNRLPVNVKSKKRYIAPDTSSIIFWLKNRESEYWKDKVEVEETGGNGYIEVFAKQLMMRNMKNDEEKQVNKKADK